jgi:hypothetical protein
MGFTAIWITPVTEQLPQDTGDGEAYHGYWQQNMYVMEVNFQQLLIDFARYEIDSNLGTAADLLALSTALHARGMHLMVDVVANHMVSCSGSQFRPLLTLYRAMLGLAIALTTACLIRSPHRHISTLTVSSVTTITSQMSRTAG